jgi:ornithine cyclodeaminase/alanine dehydrogenase-like protein (mu-crystallin family)
MSRIAPLRVLSAANIKAAITMREAIEAMRDAFGQLSSEQATMPQRTPVHSKKGVTLFMPAYLSGTDDLALKIVSIYDQNPTLGWPLVMALVTVLDAQTGAPRAVMDGTYLTALRTGAASGLATEILARPQADVVALFGAGGQAGAQLEAVCTARTVREVRVYARTAARVSAFIRSVAGQGPIPSAINAAASPQAALQDASIILVATTSSTPVFDGRQVAPGAHVNGIGSFRPDMQEVDAALVTRSKVVVDQLDAAWEEAGDLIIPLKQGLISQEHVHAELGEIVNGTKPGRESEAEITFFKSVGVAAQDAAIAGRVFRAAEANNIGLVIDL